MLDTIFSCIPFFYSWISSYQVIQGLSLMDFIVGFFLVYLLLGVVLPWFWGGDEE